MGENSKIELDQQWPSGCRWPVPDPTMWEEWVAQTPDIAAMEDLRQAVNAAQLRERMAYAALTAAREGVADARRAEDRGARMRALVQAVEAGGATHVELLRPGLLARRSGLPWVFLPASGWVPARSRTTVGPGPAVEGRVAEGCRWYALPDLPAFADVVEWRLSEVDLG